MLHKIISVVTAASLLVSTLMASAPRAAAQPAESEDGSKTETESESGPPRPRAIRAIESDGDEGWHIVDVKQVEGNLVVITPAVGREIGLEESNRYSLFQGRTVYNQRFAISVFDMAVPGFQRARFLKREDGKWLVTVSFRSGRRILTRTRPIRDEKELWRLREYIEHFDGIQKGTYELERESKLPPDADFPAVSGETVSYEERVPRFRFAQRLPGEVVLKGGERVSGELVPAYSDGRIMVQTKLDARWIDVEDVERVRIQGEKSTAAIGTAFRNGMGGGVASGWRRQADCPVCRHHLRCRWIRQWPVYGGKARAGRQGVRAGAGATWRPIG